MPSQLPQYQEEEGTALLQNERATSSVRPDAMATFIFGGQKALARRLQAFAFIESDPVFDTSDRKHLDQKGRYLRSSEKAVHLVLKCRQLGMSYEQMLDILNTALDEITPTDVHIKMAIPTLMHQTTPGMYLFAIKHCESPPLFSKLLALSLPYNLQNNAPNGSRSPRTLKSFARMPKRS